MPSPKGHRAYNTQGEGGRPCRYSSEDIERYADKFKEWLLDPSHIWFKDFCLDHDIDPDLMAEWAKSNKRFNGAYRFAKYRQESRLVNGGLQNKLNSMIVKFVLTNAHDWADRQQLSGDAAHPLQFILDKGDGSSKELVKDEEE